MRVTGLDPMNIISLDDLILHQRSVNVNGFSSQTLQLNGDSCWGMKELQFYSKDKPPFFFILCIMNKRVEG